MTDTARESADTLLRNEIARITNYYLSWEQIARLRALAARPEPEAARVREAALREASAIALADKTGGACPFEPDHPRYRTLDIEETDPCPTCGQTGLDDGSLCHSKTGPRIAAAILAALATPPAPSGEGRE